MNSQNSNTSRRTSTTNSKKTNNSTRRRRGAMTPNNARRIRGRFQKPPLPPRKKPLPPIKTPARPRVLYTNNINIGNLSANEINAIIRNMS